MVLLTVLPALAAGMAGFACRQASPEKASTEARKVVELQGGRAEVEKPPKIFVRGIEALPEVERVVDSLLALCPPGASEPAEVPPELTETVRQRLDDEGLSVAHKTYLLTAYLEKAKWLPPEWLRTLVADAQAADLTPELNYCVAQLCRSEIKRLPAMVADGELTSGEGAALAREFGDPMVELLQAAYEGRKREPVYTMGLLGGYYERARALAGGREPKYADAVAGLSPELETELFERLDAGEMFRALVGAPWLLYVSGWRWVPPQAVGRELLWGAWSTGVDKVLLVRFRQELADADWVDSFRMVQRIRTVVGEQIVGIDWADSTGATVRALIESLVQAPLPSADRKAARQLLADFNEFDAVWAKQREEAREERNRLLVEGDCEAALRVDDMHGRTASSEYHAMIDRVEDIIRPHSAEAAHTER